MAKKIRNIIAIGIIALNIIGLSACIKINAVYPNNPYYDPDNPVVESECGLYKVQLRHNDGYAVVIELTEEGKKEAILAIPSHVEGLTVKQVGWKKGYVQMGLNSDVLRKIYIASTVERLENFVSVKYGECILLPAQSEIDYSFIAEYQNIVFTTQERMDALNESNYYKKSLKLPNLIYLYNYENAPNLGYYWFDNITGENLFIDPSDPVRDGYTFTGWFLEAECINEWNGIKPSSTEEKLNLFAGWEIS